MSGILQWMIDRIRRLANLTLAQAAMPLIAIVVGLIALVVASTVMFLTGTNGPVSVLGFWIAQTTLGAGIVVGVMRALQSADYFEDGLRRVLYDEKLSEGPIDFSKSWRNLTIALIKRRFETLDPAASDVQHADLTGKDSYYYADHRRFVKIKWLDRTKSTVEINDRVVAKLRTATTGPIRFENRFRPEADTSRRSTVKCTFSGKDFSKTIDDKDMAENEDGHGFSIDLPLSSEIDIVREFRKVQDLDEDPILNYTSSAMVNCPRVDIRCETGLKFYFRKTGMASNFVVENMNTDLDAPLSEVVARYDGLCFRNQGYIIVIVKV